MCDKCEPEWKKLDDERRKVKAAYRDATRDVDREFRHALHPIEVLRARRITAANTTRAQRIRELAVQSRQDRATENTRHRVAMRAIDQGAQGARADAREVHREECARAEATPVKIITDLKTKASAARAPHRKKMNAALNALNEKWREIWPKNHPEDK